MPIFEFRCMRCENEFEALIRGSEQSACPECGSQEQEKLLSAPAAHASRSHGLPIASSCPPSDAPPCSPNCCRL